MAMSQREYLKFCLQEVYRSRKWRGDDLLDESWKRFIDLYRGKHYGPKAIDDNDRLIVNLVFSTKNVLGPAVAINNPKFIVNPRTPESAAQAILTQEILNYVWQSNHYQGEFRLAVDDFILVGHGWLKVGYQFLKKPESKPSEAEPGGVANEDINEGVDDREDREGNVESEQTVFDTDRPFVERISPFDIYVDPEARHPKEMRWIAQRTWRPVQDISVDSRYSATARKKVSGRSYSRWNTADATDARDGDTPPQQGVLQYGEVIEFWDIKRNQVSTFALNGQGEDFADPSGGFLKKPEDIPYAAGQPFVMIRNFDVPDHFYPIGDVEQIESLQMELNETRTQMLNHRKRFSRKWIYDASAFDSDGVEALESEVDNVMIPTIGDVQPTQAVAPLPAVTTPVDFYNQSDMISTDMDRVSGVSDYQRGQPSDTISRTATEAAMIQDASNARAQDRLDRIEHTLAAVGERIIGLMQQYMSGEQTARIVSVPGAAWLKYDKNYIKGKFDFSVVAGSTEPMNETFKRQSSLQIVDASMPFLENGVADPVALYRKVLDGFGIKDPTRFISDQAQQGPPPPPEGVPPVPGGPASGNPAAQAGPPPLPPEVQAQMAPGMPLDQVDPALMAQLAAQGAPAGPDQISPEMLLQMLAMEGMLPPS